MGIKKAILLCAMRRLTNHNRQCTTTYKVFFIAVCAYAVMSNYTHFVLYADDQKRINLVVIRWHKLFKRALHAQNFLAGVEQDKSQQVF